MAGVHERFGCLPIRRIHLHVVLQFPERGTGAADLPGALAGVGTRPLEHIAAARDELANVSVTRSEFHGDVGAGPTPEGTSRGWRTWVLAGSTTPHLANTEFGEGAAARGLALRWNSKNGRVDSIRSSDRLRQAGRILVPGDADRQPASTPFLGEPARLQPGRLDLRRLR